MCVRLSRKLNLCNGCNRRGQLRGDPLLSVDLVCPRKLNLCGGSEIAYLLTYLLTYLLAEVVGHCLPLRESCLFWQPLLAYLPTYLLTYLLTYLRKW